MNLGKAIEFLEEYNLKRHPYTPRRWCEAQQLGIEALKWRQLMENDYGSWCGPLLPGETEE